jgi:hypothetical protein
MFPILHIQNRTNIKPAGRNARRQAATAAEVGVNDMPKACGQTGCRRKESERRVGGGTGSGLASQNTRGQYGQEEAQHGAMVSLTRGWGTTAPGLPAGVPWAVLSACMARQGGRH